MRNWICVSLVAITAPLATQDSATFRAETQLVTVSVVAQDKQSKPVPDLDREDFQLFDNGAARDIRLFADATPVGDVLAETVKLNLRPETWAKMLQTGLPYPKEMRIPAKAVELKVVVGNLASGRIGTLTIPLSEVKAQ